LDSLVEKLGAVLQCVAGAPQLWKVRISAADVENLRHTKSGNLVAALSKSGDFEQKLDDVKSKAGKHR